jgi:phage gp36-like protein
METLPYKFQYIDVRFMEQLFGHREMVELTDRDGTPTGEIIPAVVARHIESAESIANSYLNRVYKLPLPSVPRALQLHVADIARYYLYDEQPTQIVIDRYLQAIDWLKDVANGLVDLGFANSDDQPASDVVVIGGRSQVFSDKIMSQMDLTTGACGKSSGGMWGI